MNMKQKPAVRIKFPLTLDNGDALIFAHALDLVCPLFTGETEHSKYDRIYLARWAIRTFCAAICRDGGMPKPPAVEIRPETRAEGDLRIRGITFCRDRVFDTKFE